MRSHPPTVRPPSGHPSTARPPAVRRLLPAALAAAALLLTGATASSAAAGGPDPSPAGPPPPARFATAGALEVAPGLGFPDRLVLADDAVYLTATPWDTQNRVPGVYVRTVDRTATGTALGPLTLVGRAVLESRIAEHAGTLAYARHVDQRLVLRAPDGTRSTPAWGDHPGLGGGVLDLSDTWLVGTYDLFEPDAVLFDRRDGAAFPLIDLAPVPAQLEIASVREAFVSEDRLLFAVYAYDRESDAYLQAVHTVALGADGPVGPVATLAQVEVEDGAGTWGGALPRELDGERVVWDEWSCGATSPCEQRVRWFDAAPYTGTPSETAVSGRVLVEVEDGALVLAGQVEDPWRGRVEWIPLGGDGVPTRTFELAPEGVVGAVHGSWVSWVEGAAAWLADADGGTVTGDQTPVTRQWPFDDVQAADPFAGEILWLRDAGVVGGYPDGTFRNRAAVSREAMAAFLYRIVHEGARAPSCTGAAFADVPVSHPFCGEIAWLADAGVSTGWADGTFRPGQAVTREAMAAFLYRLAEGGDAPSCTAAPFADVPPGHPFCGAVAWMADAGISTGWPDGTFRPGLTIERQAMAAFLFRFIDGGHVPTS